MKLAWSMNGGVRAAVLSAACIGCASGDEGGGSIGGGTSVGADPSMGTGPGGGASPGSTPGEATPPGSGGGASGPASGVGAPTGDGSSGGSGGSECKAGKYVGTWTCAFDVGGLQVEGDVVGDMEICLTSASEVAGDPNCTEYCLDYACFECDDLVIESGTMSGTAQDMVDFMSELSGGLNCEDATFIGAIENGIWGFQPLPPTNPFSGTFDATYDASSLTLAGEWDIVEETSMGSCPGMWQAQWVSDSCD